MQTRRILWKFLTNPTVEVVAAIVAVLLALWMVVQADLDLRPHGAPIVVPFAHK
jgi:hypothetical protein